MCAAAVALGIIHFIIVKQVFETEPSEKYNAFLASAAKQLLFFAVMISIMFASK